VGKRRPINRAKESDSSILEVQNMGMDRETTHEELDDDALQEQLPKRGKRRLRQPRKTARSFST
jgi:hypothetical protein